MPPTITGYDPNAVVESGTGSFSTPLGSLNVVNATIAGGIAVNQGQLTINASGVDIFNLSASSSDYSSGATVDLARNSEWIGTFSTGRAGFINVNGAAGSVWVNDGMSHVFGITATISVPVAGAGGFDLTRDRGQTASLTVNSSMGAQQTVTLDAGNISVLTLNDPKDFHGKVAIGQYNGTAGLFGSNSAEINLNHLANAHSYSFQNDMLTIYGTNGKPIDTLHLQSPVAFSVERTATGVSIYTAMAPHPTGTILPLHGG